MPEAPASDVQSARSDERVSVVASAVLAGLVTIAMVVYAVTRFLATFTSEGLVVETDVPRVHATGASVVYSRGAVTVENPDAALQWAAGGSILLVVLSTIAIAALYLLITIELAKERTFSARTAAMVQAVATTLFVTAFGCYLLDSFVADGARAAAGLDEVDAVAPPVYWMSFAVASGISLIAVAFRRGQRMQRDTEGLV